MIGERKTRELLNRAVEKGVLLDEGKTSNKKYKLNLLGKRK